MSTFESLSLVMPVVSAVLAFGMTHAAYGVRIRRLETDAARDGATIRRVDRTVIRIAVRMNIAEQGDDE